MYTFLPLSLVYPLVICLAASVTYLLSRRSPHARSFPGPRAVPYLGNLSTFFCKEPWVNISRLRKIHGPIASLHLLGTSMIALNNASAARKLLENKSSIYSNRPCPKMIKLCGFDKGIVLERDPVRLRHSRRLLNQALHQKRISQWAETLEYHTRFLLRNLAHDPARAVCHIRQLSAGVTIEISHGYRITSPHDSYVVRANMFTTNFGDATLMQYAVDWFPWLAFLPSWLPGMKFKRTARLYRQQYFALAEEGHQMVKDDIARGSARPSITYSSLMDDKPGANPDDIIMFAATQVYTGGGDTSSSILTSLVLLMVLHPDIQRRAQEEIDMVVGAERLPQLKDRASLSYVEAIILEVARLRPPVNMMFRDASEDDTHDGCFIPKGTSVIVNMWAMLHDENIYSEPDLFRPERWLGAQRDPDLHPFEIVFGFGRRTCPGKWLAEEILFLSASRMLALFNMTRKRDSAGNFIQPREGMTNKGITSPLPFECSITPRSAAASELVGDCGDEIDT